jgi:hypothetical protein
MSLFQFRRWSLRFFAPVFSAPVDPVFAQRCVVACAFSFFYLIVSFVSVSRVVVFRARRTVRRVGRRRRRRRG